MFLAKSNLVVLFLRVISGLLVVVNLLYFHLKKASFEHDNDLPESVLDLVRCCEVIVLDHGNNSVIMFLSCLSGLLGLLVLNPIGFMFF